MNERQHTYDTTVFHHYSIITSREYRIDISRVGDISLDNPHVLYVLDGIKNAPLLSILAQSFINPTNPQHIIIVGIDYKGVSARSEDYLPNDDKDLGASLFYRCLSQEIHPLIVEECKLKNYTKSIFGHSYGAIFAFFVLCHHGENFSHYFISSPSLWANETRMIECEQHITNIPDSVYISCAEYEQYPQPTANESTKRIEIKTQRKMCCNSLALYKRLNRRFPNTDMRYHNYREATHQSVVPLSAYDALKYLLT